MPIVEIKAPSPGESITEVQISRWIKTDGSFVEKDEELAEIESDKATLSLTAETSGVLHIKMKEGENIPVGAVVGIIDTSEPASEKKQTRPGNGQTVQEKNYAAGIPSPAAGKIMRESGITPSSIKPSGKDGRITKGDVLKASIPKSNMVPEAFSRNERREKMSMLRKKVSERLVAVKQETAMLTTFNEADMSAIMEIRKKYKDAFKEHHGVNLGFMSFFTRAVCGALRSFPAVNARIEGDEIIYHDYCDIGIAVSAPKGLMVPVIRNAESLSLAQIEIAVLDMATKARESKLTIDEMTGGTFTITNGGVFGSMLSTPIINPPQSAILGMHNIVERPVAVNGRVEIRPVMYLALSYDHRIIDGRESVGFLVRVKQMIEDPVKILLGGKDPVKTLLEL